LPGVSTLSGGTTAEKPGTIMSYCHLVNGGMSNISFTFGKDHLYGVAPDRVPLTMQSHVLSRADLYPECLQLENTIDTTPPEVQAPLDIHIIAKRPVTKVSLGTATAFDTVDGILVPTPDPLFPYFGIGVNTVTWSASDSAGNIGKATQVVTIQKPELQLNQNVITANSMQEQELNADTGISYTHHQPADEPVNEHLAASNIEDTFPDVFNPASLAHAYNENTPSAITLAGSYQFPEPLLNAVSKNSAENVAREDGSSLNNNFNIASIVSSEILIAPSLVLTKQMLEGRHHITIEWKGLGGDSVYIKRSENAVTTIIQLTDNSGQYIDTINVDHLYKYQVCDNTSACTPVVSTGF
jgi:hypothetical protein